jgi:diadenosine tetraphosphate (Ap4A) HIT family hydrolase
MFQLHERLQADTVLVAEFNLSLVLLNKDANYPWIILVPKRHNIQEIYQLAIEDRQQLLHESCTVAETMTALFNPDKLNIATIGNMVPQLHMHHVARFNNDGAWPGPIWGVQSAASYNKDKFASLVLELQAALPDCGQE